MLLGVKQRIAEESKQIEIHLMTVKDHEDQKFVVFTCPSKEVYVQNWQDGFIPGVLTVLAGFEVELFEMDEPKNLQDFPLE